MNVTGFALFSDVQQADRGIWECTQTQKTASDVSCFGHGNQD